MMMMMSSPSATSTLGTAHALEQDACQAPLRRTKVVATLGPVSRHAEGIRELILAGANVFRFNYSHAEYEELKVAYKNVRAISQELGRPVAILSDLQGPKFRVGYFEAGEGIELVAGDILNLAYGTTKAPAGTIYCNVKPLIETLHVGCTVLFEDGTYEMLVTERTSPECVKVKVLNSGFLKERKGINVPSIRIPVPALTEKDKEDCRFALAQGTDFIALSFVQCAQDVKDLKELIEAEGFGGVKSPKIVCKMEKPQALDALDAILEETDALMVARGDLGVELRPEEVPAAQKRMIAACKAAGKPVITATQMLESMIKQPVPTRAEVSDVANAIYDGTDAVMLSAETASGAYAQKAVAMMTRIALEVEQHLPAATVPALPEPNVALCPSLLLPESIARSAVAAAEFANAQAIVVLSYSGQMASRLAKYRPNVPVVALTPNESVFHQLCLVFGVYPQHFVPQGNTEDTLHSLRSLLLQLPSLKAGDTVVLCSGQTDLLGLTNSLRIVEL
jgi:pyruvate kinase